MELHPMRYYQERDGLNYNTCRSRMNNAIKTLAVYSVERAGNAYLFTESQWEAIKATKAGKV